MYICKWHLLSSSLCITLLKWLTDNKVQACGYSVWSVRKQRKSKQVWKLPLLMKVSLITIRPHWSPTLRRKNRAQKQRATSPDLTSYAAKPLPPCCFAQAQTAISVTAYSYITGGPGMAGRGGLMCSLAQSSVSHWRVFNKRQESIKMYPIDLMVTLQICFIEVQILWKHRELILAVPILDFHIWATSLQRNASWFSTLHKSAMTTVICSQVIEL